MSLVPGSDAIISKVNDSSETNEETITTDNVTEHLRVMKAWKIQKHSLLIQRKL